MARIKYYNKQTSQWEYADNVLASGNQASTPEDIGAVPITRKINNKELSNDITLTADDVGAKSMDWMPTAEDVSAAPRGYGLGEYIGGYDVLEDANTAVLSGWYRVAATTKNYGLPYGIMRVEALSSSKLIQTAITVADAKEYRRSCVDGVWSEWKSLIDAIGAAPAGYGLGGYSAWKGIATVAEIDDIKANGKYNINQTNGTLYLEGIAFNALNLEVSMINANYGTQVISFLDGYVIRRRCNNGIWEPWEWEIYPLTQGVEYRTIEKLNGSPVYVKYINIGYLASGTHSLAHNCAVSLPLSLDFYNNNQELLNGYSNITNLTADRTNIHITCGNAFGNINVLMKYTKVGG